MLTVTYLHREPRKTGFSMEGIFRMVKECLQQEISFREFQCNPHLSRYKNTLEARKFAGELNHITGDVNFLALGLMGKKNILTVHDMGHYDTLRPRKLAHWVYKTFWYQLPLKNIDIVTVVSEFTKAKLMEYTRYPEDRIRVIKNPVKPVFQYSPKDEPNSRPRILMLGSGRHKNLDNLLEAIKNGNYHLDIVGFPSDEESAKLKEYKIHHTIFSGLSDDEVYRLYKECDVLYIASFYEGFGMPIIEAQAIGRPVITSNLGAMKEVAGDSAHLVDPCSPADIKAGLEKIVNDGAYYRNLVEMGRKNVVPFEVHHIADQYRNIYFALGGNNK